MNTTQLIQKIQSLQSDIESLSFSAVEKDILLGKIASLYERLLAVSPVTITEEQPFVQTEKKVEKEEFVVEKQTVTIIEETAGKAVFIAEDTEIVIAEKTAKKPQNSSLLGRLEKEEKPLLNERFQQQAVGLNERIIESDLKKLIDFNRQFVFIQELFHSDAIAYMKAIERINDMATLEDAFSYMNNEIIHKYKWRPEQQSVKLFEKLVRQKFGKQ